MLCSSLPPVVCRRVHALLTLFVLGAQHISFLLFLRTMHPILPVSLDCPFLIVPSIFSNVYLYYTFHQEGDLRPYDKLNHETVFKMSLSSKESDLSCICVLWILICLFPRLVCWISELCRHCGNFYFFILLQKIISP